MQLNGTIEITKQRRTRVNTISKIRKYISKRAKSFSKLNIQTATIGGVKVRGSMRDLRTLSKNIKF